MAQLYDGEPRRGHRRLDPELLSDIRRHLAAAGRKPGAAAAASSTTPAKKPRKRRVTAPGRHAERERRAAADSSSGDESQGQGQVRGRVRGDSPRAASSRAKGDAARPSAKASSKASSSGASSKGSSSSGGKARSSSPSHAARDGARPAAAAAPRAPSARRPRRKQASSPREEKATEGRTTSKRAPSPSPPQEVVDENVAVHANSSQRPGESIRAAPRRRHTTSVTSPRREAAGEGATEGGGGGCAAWCGAQPHDASAPCRFLLNQASGEHLYAFFQQAPRLGLRTAHRVLSVREEGGPYFSGGDFDRRLTRITYARLLAAAQAIGAEISLDLDVQPMGSREEAGCSVVATMVMPAAAVPVAGAGAGAGAAARPKSTLRVASWNAGHFSLGSRFVKEKTSNLVRFVRSERPKIVALQEVYAGVPRHLARCLTKASRVRWRCVGDEDVADADGGGALRQAFLYDSTAIRGVDATPDVPGEVLAGFLRAPRIAAFNVGGEVLVMVNVHLSTRFKEGEVRLLPPLVRACRAVVDTIGGDERGVMVVGDYNVASDAQVFDGLRDAGLVEIVRPPQQGATDGQFLTSCTTVGGEYFDNLWLHADLRRRVGSAWVWQFGGRGQGLGTTAMAHAGSRRAKRSDHFVLVTELEMGDE